jgi:hypothetical protein
MPQRKQRRPSTPPAAGRVAASRPHVAAAEAPKRDWRRLAIGAAGVAGIAAFVFFIASGVGSELFGEPEGVLDVAVDDPAHVEGDIEYDGHPAGGAHSEVWLNCGVYTEPVPEENAVHSLEHGAVWITYPTDDPTVDVQQLTNYAGRNKVIVSPVAGQLPPVLVTAWAHQMETETADDPRITQFIGEFMGASSAPEPGGLCTGGTGQPA